MKPSQARTVGRDYRRGISPAKRAYFNARIQTHIQRLSGRIASYWALPEEADPGRRAGDYLPVIDGASLVFKAYICDTQCELGALNIPVPMAGETLKAEDMDWVLVPLTAYDLTGMRVGMGGGFYDQTLDRVPRHRRIGVAYPGQCVSQIWAADWDLPLGGVITPAGLRRF